MEQLSKEYVAVPIARYEQLICVETKMNVLKKFVIAKDGKVRSEGACVIARILEREGDSNEA